MSEAEGSTDHPPTNVLISELTKEYGRVHSLNVVHLRNELLKIELDVRGSKEVLKRRLKEHLRQQHLALYPHVSIWQRENPHTHYAVIDFEATCDQSAPEVDFMHEIIEVPVILISAKDMKVVEEFHEYVKPGMVPILSPFCKKLTGIGQATINKSRPFTEVWSDLEQWLKAQNIENLCWVTDGPWDFKKFLAKECRYNNLSFPRSCTQYCNIRRKFCNFYGVKRVNLSEMLRNLGMEFEGRMHSGICDSRNIANVVCTMLQDGAVLTHNEVVDVGEALLA